MWKKCRDKRFEGGNAGETFVSARDHMAASRTSSLISVSFGGQVYGQHGLFVLTDMAGGDRESLGALRRRLSNRY